MKKVISLLVSLFVLSANSLFALGSDAFPTSMGNDGDTSSQSPWKYDFLFSGRVVGSTGMGLDKDQHSGKKAGLGASTRMRPEMKISNGNFIFGLGLGVDAYLGGPGAAISGGFNIAGYGLGENHTAALQLRRLYMGYVWDSGVYSAWGIQDAYIPYLNADAAAGVTVGWKNSGYDVTLFYFQLIAGAPFALSDKGGLFGIKADISPIDDFNFVPFILGLAQGQNLGRGYSEQQSANSNQYFTGAKFVNSVGMYLGLDFDYTAPFGLFVNLKALYALGKNKHYQEGFSGDRYNQTRNAFGAFVTVGYVLEEMLKASIFLDFRSGSKTDTNRNGTNASFNGAVLEYDADTPPLLIIYNAGDGRQGFQYTDTFNDGYAFTDRGVASLGANAKFTLSSFDIGLSLGYAWYAAAKSGNSAGIGFEADLMFAYNMTAESSLYLQGGIMVPGQGVKDEHMSSTGLSSFRSQMPWLVNIGMKYVM